MVTSTKSKKITKTSKGDANKPASNPKDNATILIKLPEFAVVALHEKRVMNSGKTQEEAALQVKIMRELLAPVYGKPYRVAVAQKHLMLTVDTCRMSNRTKVTPAVVDAVEGLDVVVLDLIEDAKNLAQRWNGDENRLRNGARVLYIPVE